MRALDTSFTTVEWGFALGRPFWGTGLFLEGATHTLDFTFGALGVSRLEARAAEANGRGNGALLKIGAVRDAVLRRSFRKDGRVYDQALWSLLDTEWQAMRAAGTEEAPRPAHARALNAGRAAGGAVSPCRRAPPCLSVVLQPRDARA